jgi:hypothetical protein
MTSNDNGKRKLDEEAKSSMARKRLRSLTMKAVMMTPLTHRRRRWRRRRRRRRSPQRNHR